MQYTPRWFLNFFFHAFVFTINIPTAATASYLLLPTYYLFVSEWFCSANKPRRCLTRHRCSFVEVWDTLHCAVQRDFNTAVKEFQFAATLLVTCSCSRGANCSHWLTWTPMLDVNILETTTDGAAEETFVHGYWGGTIGDDNAIRLLSLCTWQYLKSGTCCLLECTSAESWHRYSALLRTQGLLCSLCVI